MAEISKAGLKVVNNQNFPDNNTGFITPSKLREFNTDLIDSTVNQATYSADIAAIQSDITALEAFTASQQPSFDSLNAFTASTSQSLKQINSFTQSAGAELDSLSAWTGSWNDWTSSINEIRDNGILQGYSTRFYFSGLVSASIVPNVGGTIASIFIEQDGSKLNTSSFNSYTQSTAATQSVFSASVATSISQSTNAFNTFSSSQNIINQSVTASLVELLNLSSSLSGGYATQGELDASASALQSNIDTLSSSQALINEGQAALNGTFATTGSNTFIGSQILADADTNSVTLTPVSGSLMLTPTGFTTSSANLLVSSSNLVNLILKLSDIAGDTHISGSGNIFANSIPANPGFRRQVGNLNIFNNPALPQISSSAAFQININSNVGPQQILARAPISASIWNINSNVGGGVVQIGPSNAEHAHQHIGQLSVSNNTLNGNINVVAKNSLIYGSTTIINNDYKGGALSRLVVSSSAMSVQRNTIAGSNTSVHNDYFSGSAGFGITSVVDNIIYGDLQRITFTGSALGPVSVPNAPSMISSMMMGYNNQSIIYPSKYIGATSVLGNGLIVSASSNVSNTNEIGAVIAGRWNANDGVRNAAGNIVLAVGTGTSNTARKTGFLIDTGSNAFVEGTLNISGSITISGSAYGNVFSASIVSNTASIDLSVANYFTLRLEANANTRINVINPQPGVTATLLINTDATSSVSWSTNIKQPSASVYVPSISGNVDAISLTAFDTESVYAIPAYAFV